MKRFGYLLLTAFLGAIVSVGVYKILDNKSIDENIISATSEPVPVHLASQTYTYSPQLLPDFTEAAGKTINTVVHVMTEYKGQSHVYDYFFDLRDFFGEPGIPEESPQYLGSGSGVIIATDGYIVTNNHVVKDATRIQVVLNDKRTYDATIIGSDPSTDLALLRINETNLPAIAFGNSNDLKIGEWVLAVGNPFNLTSTVTAGIVSAKARNINILQTPDGSSAIESFIQTDAAVNKGNSGGALVNTMGELVGVNSAIASGTGYYSGYSFAIPSNLVKKVVDDLKSYGQVQRALIGVQIRDIDSDLASEMGLSQIKGVYVTGVTDNGSAKEAGIQSGDIITRIDNTEVNSTSELLELIGQKRPGDIVTVFINRDKVQKSFQLTLKNKSGTTEVVKKEDPDDLIAVLGGTFRPVTDEEKNRLFVDYGLKVTGISEGKLMDAGIREGFIILRIDKTPVESVEDLESALDKASGGVLIEGIYPNGLRAYYGIGW